MNIAVCRDIEQIEEELCEILKNVSEGKISITVEDKNKALPDLGMDSVTLLSFLVVIEDSMGVEWSTDLPPTTFNTISSIASYLVGEK